ncbi:MAG: Type IV pilus biogenesis and competence protein PilQ precursor [Syntrophorhabdus sp. PtaU1.Bin153]|nr:MAG: Type IV pilus biogenesis and competence protein PilQ precursor [Syntrophorhabdus sp. PtaU1.Bin153]
MLNTRIGNGIFGWCVLIGIALLFCSPVSLWAAGPDRIKIETTEKVTVTLGKSVILQSPEPIKRVALAQPAIADAMVLSPRQIYLSGKTPGLTSLTLWGTGDNIFRIFDVEVVPDVNRLKERLHTMLPEERNIQVTAAADHLTLAGTVSSASIASQVVELAMAYAPSAKEGEKPKLINLLEVGGVQQVMLEVRVSEMSRTLGRRLGVNFNVIGRGGREGNVALLSQFPIIGDPSEFGSIFANYIRGDVTWTLLIDALKENGLLKVLAEPTLITLSGKEAKFLAGGEFPVPIPQSGIGTTTITIEYKPFGVGLSFTPTVLGNGKINMQVAPEVSELDFTMGIALQGYVIPSITTRRVATTVELADGQSFAIAGLLREETRETIKKFPLLGDIPILGALFRSSEYQNQESELVVIVTPHLVKPVNMAKQTLPTDQFVEPNDFEFYLLGALEGNANPVKTRDSVTPPTPQGSGETSRKFGHIAP